MDALKKAEIELQNEMWKQLTINNATIAIVLHRYYDWGAKKINGLFARSERAWEQCADTNEKSMLQMLEQETGIEIRNSANGKSWHDLAYLNATIDLGKLSKAQWIYMRHRQKEWVGAQVVACLLLALHRRYGWGMTRCVRLLELMEEVKAEFGNNAYQLKTACLEEVGIKIKDEF